MKSNKELTQKEFEVSHYLKRAMTCTNLSDAKEYVKLAIQILHS